MNKFVKKALLGSLIFSMIGSTTSVFAMNYIVQSNDTYWKISQKYSVDINTLLKVNNATESSTLYVGQEIIVPDGENFFYYDVKSGDTAWLISQKFKVSLKDLLSINNLGESSMLYVNQKIKIPILTENTTTNSTSTTTNTIPTTDANTDITNITPTTQTNTESFTYYQVKSGDTGWIISQKFGVALKEFLSINNLTETSPLYVNQNVKIPKTTQTTTSTETTTNTTNTTNTTQTTTTGVPEQPKVTITYINHTVKSGDNFWNIALKYGVTMQQVLSANNATTSTYLKIGDIVKIPQYNVPVMQTLGEKYGEYLDWWTGAQYVAPIGSTFKVIDFNTGKSFTVKRTYGANHADVETVTSEDTRIFKEIFGGSFSWATRPVIIEYNGRKLAASVAGMPHAGNDSAPADINTTWRSGDYGAGPNFDAIKGNNMDGHFDIHFLNSTTHNTGQISESHQKNIKISSGIIK